jgi:type II secretion system protein G
MNKKGFTLIEMLVVMAIIGVLAAISLVSFQTAQTKSRDSQRKSDLKQIANSLETYLNDKGEYPENSLNYEIVGCEDVGAGPTTCSWGSEWSDENDTIYMPLLPADPNSGSNYYYESDGSSYQLYARLENTLDGAIPTLSEAPANYGVSCGNYNCNFGVASSNLTVSSGRTITLD